MCGKKLEIRSTTRELHLKKCENCLELYDEAISKKITRDNPVKYCYFCSMIINTKANNCPLCGSKLSEEIKEAKTFPARNFQGINSLKYFGFGFIIPGLLMAIPILLTYVFIFPHFLIISISLLIRGIRLGIKDRKHKWGLAGLIANSFGIAIQFASYIFLIFIRYF